MTKPLRLLVVSSLVLLSSACSLPAYRQMQDAGQSYQVVSSERFKHLLAANSLAASSGPVVIFIEGDGKPWQNRSRIAFDPTPDDPLLLGWFLSADYPAIYLGRPCYFQLGDQNCSAYWYTHGRYSESVVSSMVEALHRHVTNDAIVLVGHSGGGTLAMLMAEKLHGVKAVITIAGNLQVQSWSDFHHYSSLHGSLDPGMRQSLPAHIRQMHFCSPFDQVIKAEWVKEFGQRQHSATIVNLPVQGHDSAWNGFYEEFRMALFELGLTGSGANIE